MAKLANIHGDRIDDIKKKITSSYQNFTDNFKRFKEFKRFVFKTTLSSTQKGAVNRARRPEIEFNILEAYISRLMGEFAKSQPDVSVRAEDGVDSDAFDVDFGKLIKLFEMHLRSVLFDGNNDSLEYETYSDLLAGGFSVVEVLTDYINSESFDQKIQVRTVFDPTLCGFDNNARESHKGDGKYCFQLYPMNRKDFISAFGEEAANDIKFSLSIGSFSWATRGKTRDDDTILVGDYFEKKKKKKKIVLLSNGKTMSKQEYEKYMEDWYEDDENELQDLPPIIAKERTSYETKICKFRICENKVLSYEVTDYDYFPLIFFDGNSQNIYDGAMISQMTRPYVYHAKNSQQMKNMIGQALASSIDNQRRPSVVASFEGMPQDKDYKDQYINLKTDSVLVYHAYDPDNKDRPLPAPHVIPTPPFQADVMAAFGLSDSLIQQQLGSYDASLGVNDNQLSGRAISLASIHSNKAAIPYTVGYMKGMSRVAKIIISMIPKYYTTPRSIPVMNSNGERGYVKINGMKSNDQEGMQSQAETNDYTKEFSDASIQMDYNPLDFNVKVEAGVSFGLQKEVALQTIKDMMQSSKSFSEFIDSKGLDILIDNIEIRGAQDLKEKAKEYLEEREVSAKKASEQQQMERSQMMQMQQRKSQKEDDVMEAASMNAAALAEKTMREAESPTRTEIELIKIVKKSEKDRVDSLQNQQALEIKLADLLSKLEERSVDSQVKEAKAVADMTKGVLDRADDIMGNNDLGGNVNTTTVLSVDEG